MEKEDIMTGKIKNIKDLEVYLSAHRLALTILELTKSFPKEESYSLTNQIRRSSRSVAVNIREGYAKKRYKQVFIRHLNDALGSSEETRGWLDFCLDCRYINEGNYDKLDKKYDEVNAMLYSLLKNWQDYSDF